MLAAFIRDEGRPPGWIGKDSMKRSAVVVSTIILGEFSKGNRAICKVRSHVVYFRDENKA